MESTCVAIAARAAGLASVVSDASPKVYRSEAVVAAIAASRAFWTRLRELVERFDNPYLAAALVKARLSAGFRQLLRLELVRREHQGRPAFHSTQCRRDRWSTELGDRGGIEGRKMVTKARLDFGNASKRPFLPACFA
jgi:hypothetical protein